MHKAVFCSSELEETTLLLQQQGDVCESFPGALHIGAASSPAHMDNILSFYLYEATDQRGSNTHRENKKHLTL